jgi:phosphoglycerate kinase
MTLNLLQRVHLTGKIVLLRVDYNLPLKNGKIVDDSKITASLPTIKYLIEQKCKIIIATHLGKPNGKIVKELKTDVLAEQLQKIIKRKVIKFDDCIGKEIKEKVLHSKSNLFMLENLRFYKEEEQNNAIFAHSLADLAEIYINDAFAVSHRKHASIEAITNFLPSLAGSLLEKEICYLTKALNPKRPSIWIMGGAKLDKVNLVSNAMKKSDRILIGGALAFPFLKAKSIRIGQSKIDKKSVEVAKSLLKKFSARKIILPKDFLVTERLSPQAKTKIVNYNQIKNDQIALDLGPKTIELFKKYLDKAHTIVWNGPLGYYEWAKFSIATKEIGRYLGNVDCLKIAGGGETLAAIDKFHLRHNLTHVSTGGGAALAFLSGNKLPGIVALEKNFKKFKP